VGRKQVFAALALLAAGYIAYPYVTLYRLSSAIRHGEAKPLERLVDWDQVREGIKEDVCDAVLDEPRAQQHAPAGNKLPPFGFSFVRGIAWNAIDDEVTPTGLVSAAQHYQPAEPPHASAQSPVRIGWAFFNGPTSFAVELWPAAFSPSDGPIRLQLELRHGTWKVTRVWLPERLLAGANSRT
jgi:hypothetical protein